MAGEVQNGDYFINQYFKDLGIKANNSDVAEIYKKAKAADDDGVITGLEFQNAIQSYCDEKQLGDEYLDAYNAVFGQISGFDGNADNISYNDISQMNSLAGQSIASSESNYANNANYQAPATYSEGLSKAAQGVTPTTTAVSASDLEGQSVADLEAGRSEVLSQLQDMQSAKGAVSTERLDAAKTAYDEAVAAIAEDEELNSEELTNKKAEKDEIDGQISSQKDVITGLQDSISSQQTAIADIQSQIDSLVEPKEGDFKKREKCGADEKGNPEFREVVDTAAYEKAKAAYEQQKQALEEDKKQAEDTLAQLQLDLADAETALTQLEEQAAGIDEEINAIIAEMDQENPAVVAFNAAKDELDAAQTEYDDLVKQSEAEIAQLQDNLNAYETAISEARAAEQAEQKQQMGLQDDDRIKQDEDGTMYVEVDSWNSKGSDGNDCLSRIMAHSYDLEALGIKPGSEEYRALEKAIMDANPEIYGDENGNGGRNAIIDGTRHNSVLYTGDHIVLPDAYTALGREEDRPVVEPKNNDGKVPTEGKVVDNGDGTSTETTVNDQGNTVVTTRDQSGNLVSEKITDEKGNVISETKVEVVTEYNSYYQPIGTTTITTTTNSNGSTDVLKEFSSGASYKEHNDEQGRTTLAEFYDNNGSLTEKYEFTYSADNIGSNWDNCTIYKFDSQGKGTCTYKVHDDEGNEFVRESNAKFEDNKITVLLDADTKYTCNGKECSEDDFKNKVVNQVETWDSTEIEEGTKAHEYLDKLTSFANTDGCDVNSTQAKEYFKSTVQDALNDPEVTAPQKMALLNVLHGMSSETVTEMAEWDGLNNQYVDILEQAVDEGYSVSDIVALDNQYKTITGQSGEYLGFGVVADGEKASPTDRYIDTIIGLYAQAENPQDIQAINDTFDISALIQWQYSGDSETAKLQTLFNNICSNPNLVLDAYGDQSFAVWENQFGEPGKSAFKEILKSDSFKTDEAKLAALLHASNGDVNTMVDYFRSMGSNDQEKYLPEMLKIFGGVDFNNIQGSINESKVAESARTAGIDTNSPAYEYYTAIVNYSSTDGSDISSYDAQTYLKTTLDNALSDPNVSVSEKMILLNTLNGVSEGLVSEMAEWDGLNNHYSNMINQAITEGYDISQIIELDTQYRNMTSQHDDQPLPGPIYLGTYIDTIVSLYGQAQTPQDIKALNDAFSIGSIIQYEYSNGTETKELKTLFSKICSDPQTVMSEYLSSNPNATSAWESQYGKPGKGTFKDVLSAINSGKFTSPEGAKAAILWACGGNTNTLVDYFRSYSSGNEETYLPILMDIFGNTLPSQE